MKEAAALDDVFGQYVKQASKKADADEDEQGEDYSDGPAADELEKRVNLYVLVHLRSNGDTTRDHYKDTLVFEARKACIADFLVATVLKKCRNEGCGACV